MIELTPLDIRKKKGDLRRALRGYETGEVDEFLELAADRLELLTRENALLRERSAQMVEALNTFRHREQAMNEALVAAQQLREDVRAQAHREAEVTLREARAECERMLEVARREVARENETLEKARQHRDRFLRSYRTFLEGQIRELDAEEARRRHRETEIAAEERSGASG